MTKPINDFLTFLYRILFLYGVFMLCRVGFYLYNADLVGPLAWQEIPALLKGALIFDSGSIFYINLPFLLFSLLPFRFRARGWYQTSLMWLFIVVNACGIAVNLADIFYYPFKLARIASDDLHFATNGNFGTLLASFFADYWDGFIAWIGIGALLWYGFKKIGYRPTVIRNNIVYFVSQILLLALSAVFAVVMIRGGNMSPATFPIAPSDAGLYAAPSKTGMVLSNPFVMIRTLGQKGLTYTSYFADEELESIYSPVHQPADSAHLRIEGQPNIMLIILESFGAAHIKALSDQFAPDEPSYTPFIDSLIGEGYIFRNAYHNGIRSIDALPSLWTSIPTFKTQFLSLPQSLAPFHSLPMALKEMGYHTAFMHGAVRQSMSFVAFGKTVGVEKFVSREEYEAENGTNDFDGKWGIWDDKFFPFIAKNVEALPQPFFATMFSLSSHHPFILPKGFEGRYPEGKLPIHKMIGYSDDALRNMFKELSKNDWYKNTIFIIVADHGSGADNEKYKKVPYNFAIPMLFYSPGGLIPKGESLRPAGHIDVMPTLLGLLHYPKPYFAFGKDLFDNKPRPNSEYTINYMGAFNAIGDSLVYIFNERELSGVYNYRKDPMQKHNLAPKTEPSDSGLMWTKAMIQQYYKHVNERNYVVKER